MAKQPRVGYTKTRLCPPLDPGQAARLSEALLKDTIALVHALPEVALAVAISPPEAQPYFASITPPGTILLPVTGADIGECLVRSLDGLLALGFRKALAVNADGPSLPGEYLQAAVNLLDQEDVVFGPGEDGGYYLVGLKQPEPLLFTGIEWSTERVLSQTLAKVEDLGLQFGLTPAWYDIDFAADVIRLRAELSRLPEDRLAHTREVIVSLAL